MQGERATTKTATIKAYGYKFHALSTTPGKMFDVSGTVFIGKTKSWDKRDLYTDHYGDGPMRWYWNPISEAEMQ